MNIVQILIKNTAC